MGLGVLFLKSQTHVEKCGILSLFFRGVSTSQVWKRERELERGQKTESINIEHKYTSCQTQGPQTDWTWICSRIKRIRAVLIPKFSTKWQPNVRFMFFKIMFFTLKHLSKFFLVQPGPIFNLSLRCGVTLTFLQLSFGKLMSQSSGFHMLPRDRATPPNIHQMNLIPIRVLPLAVSKPDKCNSYNNGLFHSLVNQFLIARLMLSLTLETQNCIKD